MTELSTLNPVEGKAAMMSQVDRAALRVLKVLREGDPVQLQKGTYLQQIKFVMTIMEQCKEFRDGQFTRLVRQHAEDIMVGLESLPKRAKAIQEQKKREAEEAKRKAAEAKSAAKAKEIAAGGKASPIEKEEIVVEEKEPDFPYELAEKICIQTVVRHFDAKLDVLRSVHLYGRHSTVDIGIAPHFLYTVEFSVLIEDAIRALIMDSRDILSRRVYNDTDPKADEESIRRVLRDKSRPLLDVVESGFAGWGSSQSEAAKRVEQSDTPKKSAAKEKKGGLRPVFVPSVRFALRPGQLSFWCKAGSEPVIRRSSDRYF